MDLVDIDKLIDELEGAEMTKASSVASHPSQIGGRLQKIVPISNVFSSLDEYVSAPSEAPPPAKNKLDKNGREITIRKFANPNYAYNDFDTTTDLTSSEEEDEEEGAKEPPEALSSSSTTSATSSAISPVEDPQQPFTLTLSNDVINFEGISSISSMVEITSNYNKLKSDCQQIDEKALEIASKTSEMIIGELSFRSDVT